MQLQGMLEIRRYIKETAPLIHCITNPISIHDCANIILAAGGRPIMAEHPAEVREITAVSSALMLNLGNITDARMESMKASLTEANQRHIPVLLDLVGVTCSSLRRDYAKQLLENGVFSVIKGNISEILAVAELPFHGTGIDAGVQDALSDANDDWYCRTARTLAFHLGCTVMATGKQDLIADSQDVFLVSNGNASLSGITGTGCMVGALTAAYLPGNSRKSVVRENRESKDIKMAGSQDNGSSRNTGNPAGTGTTAALLAAATMGIAGEHASGISRGPGSFQVNLLDEIYALGEDQLLSEARIRQHAF